MPTQTGDENQNTLTGGTGNDLLYGLGDNDILYGKTGNDTLDGGTGDDQMEGGSGNDIYYVDSIYDWVYERPDAGIDEIRSSVAFINAVESVENYRFLTTDDVYFNGNELDNRIAGGGGGDTLNGGDGKDTLLGGKGNDFLSGDALNDTLDGGDGADILYGGTGDDKMVGGKGNDIYLVDSFGDVVTEEGNGGVDGIVTVLHLKSAKGGVENYTFLADESYTFTGNALNNRIAGNGQNDVLSGGEGNDTLIGDAGNDTLKGGNGNDRLEGGDGEDTLDGGAGNDTLDGGFEADKMTGGAGNDVYYVDQLDDVVIEAKNQGTDEIRSSIQLDGPIANVENYAFIGSETVEFTGTKGNNRITGEQGSYAFSGGDGDDTIIGGIAANTLNGDNGNDTLYGGAGTLHGGEGNDKLFSFPWGADQYGDAGNDTLTGSGQHDTLHGGTGNDLLDAGGEGDELDGGDGNDRLLGGGGDDFMTGGIGNDLLAGGSGSDFFDGGDGNDTLVIENLNFYQVFGGTGTDTLQAKGSFQFDLSLYAGTTIQDIERIDLSNGALNLLNLSQAAVHDISSTTDQLIIDGDKNDGVNLDPAFIASGTQVVGGETYNVYKDGAGATVLLDQAIEINPTPLMSLLNLADLDGTNGFKLPGINTNNQTGMKVAAAGDINGDGFDDYIVGNYFSQANYGGYSTTAYVVFGSATGTNPVDLGALDGTDGFALINPPPSPTEPQMLWPSFGVGDFNGDGNQDYLVASQRGHSYLVLGTPAPFAPTVDQSGLDGTNGFFMEFGSGSTRAVTAALADINGDGLDDVVVGAYKQGQVHVVLGHTGASDATVSPEFSIGGPSATGYSVDAGGDINGDGIGDLLIGAAGAVGGRGGYVVFGHDDSTPWISNVSALNGTNGFAVTGMTGQLTSIVSVGDVNGDGYDDVLLGSDANVNQYVVFGHAGGFTPSVDVSSLDGSAGFAMHSGPASGFVAAAGDINGDGFADIVVGGRYDGDQAQGAAYVIYGTETGFGGTLDLATLDGFFGFKIEGIAMSDAAGTGVSAAGDVNGDGYDDLLIGASEADPNGVYRGGEAYIVYGGDFRGQVSYQGTTGNDTHTGTAEAEIIIGGLGNDTLTGGGGKDVIRGGAGDDAIHVGDTAFRGVDGGGGTDTLHLDFAGALDLGALHGKIEGVEVLDFDNGKANAVTLDVTDLLDIDATDLDVGGVSGLHDVLKIDGNSGDSLALSSADGWGAADTATLAGYAIYTTGAVKVAVDTDVTVHVT